MTRPPEGPPHRWLRQTDLGAQRAAVASRLPPIAAALDAWDRQDRALAGGATLLDDQQPLAPSVDRAWLLHWRDGLLGFIADLDHVAAEPLERRRN